MHGDIMVVDLEKTHFGIFFGDNTGMIAGCRYLAEMLDHAERTLEAAATRALANQLEESLNRVSWNGKFYSHWVAEDDNFHPDLGVDMAKQVSLSNSYTLNRGIGSAKALAIIDTYQSTRDEMPPSSPGEFYSIYPPSQRASAASKACGITSMVEFWLVRPANWRVVASNTVAQSTVLTS